MIYPNQYQNHCLTIQCDPGPSEKYSLGIDDPSESDSLPGLQSDSDPDYLTENDGHHLINCSRFYDLVRELAFTKGQAKLLGSRLKEGFSSKYTDDKLLLGCINPFARFRS